MMQERNKGGKLIFDTFPREYVAILTVRSEVNFPHTTKKKRRRVPHEPAMTVRYFNIHGSAR
jgi:hypothetical protein